MAAVPRRRLDKASRREQLLEAAVELAAGRDLTGLSVQEIAAHAGVSEGLLYHYFPTKQALVAAAVERAAAALLDDLGTATSGGTPREQLEAGLDAYLAHVRSQPTGWRALLAARTGELAAVATAVEERSSALVLRVLGVEEAGPPLVVALAGWAALEREACLAWLDRPDVATEAVKELLTTTFLAALAAAAAYDEQARRALERLAPPAGPAADGGP